MSSVQGRQCSKAMATSVQRAQMGDAQLCISEPPFLDVDSKEYQALPSTQVRKTLTPVALALRSSCFSLRPETG